MRKNSVLWMTLALILAVFPSSALAEGVTDIAEPIAETTVREGKSAPASLLDVVCEPTDILEVAPGDFLVTDTYSKLVYEVKDGKTEVYAGYRTGGDLYGEPIGGYFDSQSEYSMFGRPWAITVFNEGYAVSDTANNSVRFVSSRVTDTITGNGTSGSRIGSGTNASFDRPTGLATDSNGDLYVADTGNGRLCRVSHLDGMVTLVLTDLDEPTALCWKNGALYICESGNNRILMLRNGETTVVAGSTDAGWDDGPAAEATFINPMGIAVSDNGTIYVSDTGNSAIRCIKDGWVSTLLFPSATALDQYPALPTGLLWSDGQLYVCDTYANKVYSLAVEG